MRKIDIPTRNTTNDLDIFINSTKNPSKKKLKLHRNNILQLFDGYENRREWDLERAPSLDHLPDDVREALRKSYSLVSPRRKLKELRAELLNVDDNLCPYCRLEPPLTLDHFLPKSLYEPFASFALNLVPMCQTCNRLKGTKGQGKARQFFTHAYFDELAKTEPFMVAQVAVGVKHIATNFLIDFSANLDAEIFQRLAYQFSILRLVPRYQLEAVDVIKEQAEKLSDMMSAGCDFEDCRRSLQGDAETEAKNFGKSYWRAALLNALASNHDFYSGAYERVLP